MTSNTQPAFAAAARRSPSFALVVLATSMAFVVGQLDVTIVNVALPAMGREPRRRRRGPAVGGRRLRRRVRGLHAVGRRARRPLRRAARVPVGHGDLRAGLDRLRAGARHPARSTPRACCRASARPSCCPTRSRLLNHALAHEPARRARAIGYWTAAGAISIALGPVLGGVLVASVGWRAIFWVNVPLCAARRLAVDAPARDARPAAPARRWTSPGQVLATLALAALIATLIESRALGLARPAHLAGRGRDARARRRAAAGRAARRRAGDRRRPVRAARLPRRRVLRHGGQRHLLRRDLRHRAVPADARATSRRCRPASRSCR